MQLPVKEVAGTFMRQKRNCLLGKVGLFGVAFSVGMQSESFNSSVRQCS